MKVYLENMKKEKVNAKGNRQLDKNEADPIVFGIYEKLCEWIIGSGTVVRKFILVFITTQWNVMGRTVNVDLDPLVFHDL